MTAAEKLRLKRNEAVKESLTPKVTEQSEVKYDLSFVPSSMKKAFDIFLNGADPKTLSRASVYQVIDDELWYIRRNLSKKKKKFNKNLLARKIKGLPFGNSSKCNAHTSRRWDGQPRVMELNVQRELSRLIPMIPFSVFKDAKLDMNELKVIEKGPSEKLDLGEIHRETKEKIYRHYTGALLFKLVDRYYLFDIDRNDLRKQNFNAFMSRLAKPVKSIEEAYASLKPKEVYQAERFLGEQVPRQGEWFFIPVNREYKAEKQRGEYVQAVLQSKGNRAHYVEKKSVEGFVTGKVTHGGWEHKPIELKGWHKPVPNTAVESFKITGAVD